MIRPLLSTLALIIAIPLAASAQSVPAVPPQSAPVTPAAAPQHHHHHSHYFSAIRTLGLSDDQKAQIRSLVRDTKAANAGADAPTRHANVKQLRAKIAAVLTADQRAQLQATLAKERATETGR